MRDATVAGAERREQLAAFVFWTAWASVTQRFGESISYTNNWPPNEREHSDLPK